MYLLAESGATKTDWIYFDQSGIQGSFRTAGLNPMVQTKEEIRVGALQELKEKLGEMPEALYFYGAGLRTSDKVEIVTDLLQDIFRDSTLHIQHDLLGAARATCGKEAGITCILGTGSNSCYYDGEQIKYEIGGNGYLFGDEGSGADLGRNIIKKALNIELPAEISKDLEAWAGKSLLQIRNEAYQHPRPNYFFAQFSEFIYSQLHKPTVSIFVTARFSEFLSKTVARYNGYQDVPLHFIGSIASLYQYQLGEACKYLQLNPHKVLRAPAEALVQYHIDQLGG